MASEPESQTKQLPHEVRVFLSDGDYEISFVMSKL